MYSHFKREVLEVINMNEKNVMLAFFLNSPPICQLLNFLTKRSRDR